jgi:hypothetical protein
MKFLLLLVLVAISVLGGTADSNTSEERQSPWLLTPLLSSSPKLGTSLGVLAGYLYHFDKDSPVSTFAVGGTYSSTHSYVVGIGGNLYFDHDRQRLVGGLAKGKINNEYNDFLGTGVPISSTDELNAAFLRYMHRFGSNWYIGAQGISTDYAIIGDDFFSSTVLEFIGLTGFKSNGIGAVLQRDLRDNQNSPSAGSSLILYNFAYRKALGGEENFDVYTLNYRYYLQHHTANVLAMRLDNRWAVDAPPAAYSSINLPGYTMGQYLAPNSIILEAEERIPIKGAFGFDAAVGIGCLYGEHRSCTDSENLFPAASAGISYLIKPKDKMVVRADVGVGKDDNVGFYLKFGQPF